MIKKKWTIQEDNIIKSEYLSNRKNISNLLSGRTLETIRCQAWKLGLVKNNKKPKWSKKEENFIKNNYEKLSREEIEDKIYNRSWKAIRLKACSLGSKKYEQGKRSDLSILLEENTITYYWIGFLMADGHFAKHSISLGLDKLDIDHVGKFCKYVNYNGDNKDKCRFSGYDKDIVPKINEKFYLNNRKTYNPPYVEWIKDKDLLLSMIIGFIDGDGSIGEFHTQSEGIKHMLRIKVHSAWLENLKYFYYFLYEYSGIYIKKKPPEPYIIKHGWALLSLYDNDVLAFIKRKILELKLPVLNRKWDKIDKNHVSKIEKERKIWHSIKLMLESNVPKTEISKKYNITTKVLYRIINE